MTISPDTRVELRRLAVAMSALTAVLYLLVGFELLYVGEPTSAQDGGLLGFGLVTGATFAVATVLLALVERRWVWIGVAVLNALVIVGYFVLAGARTPPFEWPGLLVKGVQLVTVFATTLLAVGHSESPATGDVGK